ncbi:MAG: TetR family transcriptional regulator C-terminal domain-containing protein [Desulfobacteraceae bacterium]|nr:MAG: TetR family transcriptional regulator C-terminal domain-containing protein [Desulfobacteraceae bacterium]
MEITAAKNTKEKILQVGADIIHHKGFNHTGLQEILQAAEVPKGSFYNYFKNKEDFGLQVVDHFVNHFGGLAKSVLEDSTISPLKRIENLLDFFIDYFQSEDFARGCPIGNLSQEMGDLSPAFRERLKYAIDQIAQFYAKTLIEAQIAGEIPESLDVREAAYFLVSSWHGALMRMKIVKNPHPLKNHKKFIFDFILNPKKP